MNPTILQLGPLEIRWYGLMYVISFLLGAKLMEKLHKEGLSPIPIEKIDEYTTYNLLGMFLGARFFYVFVYNWDFYSKNLGELLAVWHGGLSFHGAIIGFVLVNAFFAKKNAFNYFQILDNLALAGTPGLFFGRMGNFINGELYGRITDVPWGMVFPEGGPMPRHPSQIYEGLLEGFFLALLLWFLRKRSSYHGLLSCVFLMGYGLSRFVIEFFREPDVQLGLYWNNTLSMGQILCSMMVFLGMIGLAILFRYGKKK